MKKVFVSVVVLAVVVFTLASTGVVHAQSVTPITTDVDTEYGLGNRGGHGGRMGDGTQVGILHEQMVAIFAEKLGLSVEDIETRLTNGETMFDIATSQGLTVEEFQTMMVDVRNQAIDQAVADGTLTQIQADWMKLRSGMMGTGVNGMRGLGGGRGMMGTGSCLQVNP